MVAHQTMEQNTHELAALDYAQRGWPVFPLHGIGPNGCSCGNPACTSPGKHPRTLAGFKDATTDTHRIRNWWQRWPDANIGIATGRESGLVVVDIDPRHGGSQEALGAYRVTATVRTGGGGWHLYFAYPQEGNISSSSNRLAPGIDVRADGGYIVAAPSLHTSGNRYAWEADITLALLPAHLVERMTATKAPSLKAPARQRARTDEDADYWLGKAVERVNTDGQPRNDTGFWLACQLRDNGVSVEKACETMARYVQHVESTGEHPYTESEALASLRQAYASESRDPASRVSNVAVPPEVEFTDTGNAQRLARHYSSRLKYVPEWGWLAYSGGRWVRQADGHAMQCAKACVSGMLQEAVTCADGRRQMDLLDHARRSLAEPRLQAMLRLARSEPGIAADLHDFDADLYLLNLLNGTLDLHTGELRDHRPADLLTKIAHVTFDPDATAPRWQQFLREVFRSDEDLIAYVQRALGYSLTGDTSEQVFFTCFGSGANGKSTLLGTVMRLLGDYAQPLKADALMSNPYGNGSSANPEIAALVGARLVTAQEPKGGELDTPKVKELTGGDPMQVRELHKMPFTLMPLFKLWMSTNERPTVRETTTGIWRRIRLIPFTVSFEGRREEGLTEKLASEASGILNWLLAGCLAWQRDGLGDANAVTEATREYREEEDPYLEFFEDVLVSAEGERVELKTAFQWFVDWQRGSGAPPLSDKQFPKQAEARGYRKQRANGKRWLLGCRLVRSADSAASETVSGKSPIGVNQGSFSEIGPTSALPTLTSIADLEDELPF